MDINEIQQEMTVSIIVPAYNAERYIPECLDSIINQTLRPNEVIVVDDGSTDNTAAVVIEYTKKYSFIKYIYQENQGQGKARNMALERVESTHVMFLDSDDFIHNQTIARCAKWIVKENPDLVHFEHRKLHENGAISYPKENRFFDGTNVANGTTCERILNNSTYYTCNNLYHRGFLIDNDVRYGAGVSVQDYVFLSKVGIHAKKICFIHAPLYTYRLHSASTSHKNRDSRIQFESFLIGTMECLQAANESMASKRATAYIINHKIRAYVHMYYLKTPKEYRREFLTRLYECFLPYNYQNLPFLSESAKKFIGDGGSLTQKKYSSLVRLTFFSAARRRLRKFSILRKIYRTLLNSVRRIKSGIRKIKSSVRRIKKAFKDLRARLKKLVLSRFEKACFTQPVLDQTIAIIGFNGEWKGNGKYLYPILRNSYPNWKVVYLYTKSALVPDDIDAIGLNTFRGRSLVCRAKILFVETWERYPKRNDRLVIQLWHGTPIKKMLFDTAEPYIMKNSINHRITQYNQIRTWDYFLCDSQKAKDYFRSCFLIEDDKMLASGYPRVKYLLDNANNDKLRLKIRTVLNINADEKLISYFPTWRDYELNKSDKSKPYLLNSRIFTKHLNDSASYKLYSSGHPYGNRSAKKPQDKYDTQDYILASDWIVSDYSSVIFDAIAINTPVALLMKDRDRFERTRGLYQDIIEDLDFCTAKNEAELAEILNNPPDAAKYQYIRDTYCQLPGKFSLIDDLSCILEHRFE